MDDSSRCRGWGLGAGCGVRVVSDPGLPTWPAPDVADSASRRADCSYLLRSTRLPAARLARRVYLPLPDQVKCGSSPEFDPPNALASISPTFTDASTDEYSSGLPIPILISPP